MDILTVYNNTRSSTLFWTFGGEETQTASGDSARRRLRIFEGYKLKLNDSKIIIHQE
jgi:hypothetical protein